MEDIHIALINELPTVEKVTLLDPEEDMCKRKGILNNMLNAYYERLFTELVTEENLNIIKNGGSIKLDNKSDVMFQDVMSSDVILNMLNDPNFSTKHVVTIIKGTLGPILDRNTENLMNGSDFWSSLDKAVKDGVFDCNPPLTEDVQTPTTPQRVVEEVGFVADDTMDDVVIPTREEIRSRAYGYSGGGGGSVSEGISTLGWVAIAAAGAAIIYGGYKLWSSDETEDTIVVDIDDAF